jgi:hypothetical protein
MIHSIALLDLCEFESIGQRMPKGSGVDAYINDVSVVCKHDARKRSTGCQKASNKDNKPAKKAAIALAIEVGSLRESKLAAIHLFLEFGLCAEKERTKRELQLIAYVSMPQLSGEQKAKQYSDSSSEDESESSSSGVSYML